MSLREEIFATLVKPIGKGLIKMDYDDFDKFMVDVTNEKVDEIISKIKKRIDEMIQIAEGERITREPFPFGRVAALKEVKELLK